MPELETIPPRSVALTGAAGYVGSLTLRRLLADRRGIERVLALDVREVPAEKRLAGVTYAACDVRDPKLGDLLRDFAVDTVVHLASIVTPGKGSSRALEHDVDVNGTRNVLEACAAAGVLHLVVTSSCAAYGFRPDNPEWLREETPLRADGAFAYAHHKRLVEEMLAGWRARRPELRQLVLRPGTILGERTRNQITDLLDKPVILGVRGAASPFAFIWDEDVAACIVAGIHARGAGVYNLVGDGALPLREIAARSGKRFVPLPAGLLRGAIGALRRLGLTQYGPEQVDFLQYRSAPMNDRLKDELGFRPRLSSREVFELFRRARAGAAA